MDIRQAGNLMLLLLLFFLKLAAACGGDWSKREGAKSDARVKWAQRPCLRA